MNRSYLTFFLVVLSFSFTSTFTTVIQFPQRRSELSKNVRIEITSQRRTTFILQSTKKHEENARKLNDSSSKVPKELVDALDLYPLMESVAKHAGTKRGKDSLLALVKYEEAPKKSQFLANYNNSKRKALLASMAGGNTFSLSGLKGMTARYDTKHIIKVAQNLKEAQHEWMLIQEATKVLDGHEIKRPSDKEKNSILPLPPIYGESSSPWTISNEADSDDDEWLVSLINGFSGPMDLENILQAEQVVSRIIGSHAWAQSSAIMGRAPNLSGILKGVELDVLKQVHEEIVGTVLIRKGQKSFDDSPNSQTFLFQLNEAKFPNLTLLKNKENKLVDETKKILDRLFANKKYVAQLSGFTRNKPEPYEFEGRTVVGASQEVAQRIGVIRGHSKTGSFCYVEPNEIVKFGNELKSIRSEIIVVGNEIANHLSNTIMRAAGSINRGLDSVARLDVVFARSAFGFTLNGSIPRVEDEGVIQIKGFIHPVLAMKSGTRTVPVDLKISGENGHRSLIISGPNGGGKTLAMKSFGLAAMMAKLGVPIPRDDYSQRLPDETRIDFFHSILVEVGDHQNLMEGESTYMAQLNSLSKLLERIKPSNGTNGEYSFSSLILLDELGGGTDPTAGSCIAQAILEKIIENSSTRTVVTTHSTQLKAISIEDKRFESASVLLQMGEADGPRFRLPTYKLCYGIVGNSYALGAASRSNPPIPDDVLDRAAGLIASSQDRSGEYLRIITEALEAEKVMLEDATKATECYKQDLILCRDAMVSLAKSYDQHLSRIENRLDTMLLEMMKDGDPNAYDLVGDSLSTVRLVKRAVVSKKDMLREKGMRIISMADVIRAGDQVIVLSRGDNGSESALVSNDQSGAEFDEVSVDLEFEFGISLSGSKITMNVKRSDLAVWDYPSLDDDWGSTFPEPKQSRTVPDSRNNLLDVLGSLKEEKKKIVSPATKGQNSKFVSSRQRKAASKKSGKKNK